MREEQKRMMDRIRELEIDADKSKKDNSYLLQRTEGDLLKMQSYIDECEKTISDQRDH
jgi:hypothetical protein